MRFNDRKPRAFAAAAIAAASIIQPFQSGTALGSLSTDSKTCVATVPKGSIVEIGFPTTAQFSVVVEDRLTPKGRLTQEFMTYGGKGNMLDIYVDGVEVSSKRPAGRDKHLVVELSDTQFYYIRIWPRVQSTQLVEEYSKMGLPALLREKNNGAVYTWPAENKRDTPAQCAASLKAARRYILPHYSSL